MSARAFVSLARGRVDEMLIFGLVVFVGSVAVVMGLYVWAAWDWRADSKTPPSYRRPVMYVPPRYLLVGGIGSVVGLLLIAASQSS
jgi:hypothetical protein